MLFFWARSASPSAHAPAIAPLLYSGEYLSASRNSGDNFLCTVPEMVGPGLCCSSGRDQLLHLPMRLPLHPFFTVVNIFLLLGIAATTFFVQSLKWSVPAYAVLLGAISFSICPCACHCTPSLQW